MGLKSFVNKILQYAARKLEMMSHVGFNVERIRHIQHLKRLGVAYSRYELFKKKWLLDAGIKSILDIGANVGEFTTIFAELFPDAHIYAFEPLPDCFEELTRIANHYRGRIEAFNFALGAQEGFSEFYRSDWAPASSFRQMKDLHKKNYPHSAGSEKVKVEVKTLNNVFEKIDLKKNILIKMDVQGFEDEVIKGGLEVIKGSKVLIIECSLQNTYEGEPMFDGIYNLVHSIGFEYAGSLKQSIRKDDQSFLQADCVFIKKAQT